MASGSSYLICAIDIDMVRSDGGDVVLDFDPFVKSPFLRFFVVPARARRNGDPTRKGLGYPRRPLSP